MRFAFVAKGKGLIDTAVCPIKHIARNYRFQKKYNYHTQTACMKGSFFGRVGHVNPSGDTAQFTTFFFLKCYIHRAVTTRTVDYPKGSHYRGLNPKIHD